MILGAVLAGGAARRFGSDKALAEIGGVTLIDHAIAALRSHVDALVVCGREGGVADRPAPRMGPLGGLAGALHHAAANGFVSVITVPCDVPFAPDGLFVALADPTTICGDHPVFGHWPVTALGPLDAWLDTSDNRSIRAFAASIGAVPVNCGTIRDANTPADLAALS